MTGSTWIRRVASPPETYENHPPFTHAIQHGTPASKRSDILTQPPSIPCSARNQSGKTTGFQPISAPCPPHGPRQSEMRPTSGPPSAHKDSAVGAPMAGKGAIGRCAVAGRRSITGQPMEGGGSVAELVAGRRRSLDWCWTPMGICGSIAGLRLAWRWIRRLKATGRLPGSDWRRRAGDGIRRVGRRTDGRASAVIGRR